MKETRLSRQQVVSNAERPEDTDERAAIEIRVLDDMELVLAGGGENTDGWP